MQILNSSIKLLRYEKRKILDKNLNLLIYILLNPILPLEIITGLIKKKESY